MIQLPITSEPFQSFSLNYENSVLAFTIEFLPMVEAWIISISKDDVVLISGLRLALGNRLLRQQNYAFDIYVEDTSGLQIDPFRDGDFDSRIIVYLLEREELDTLRGYEVE